MSEPDAAFLKLGIGRADLVSWLDARPPSATKWDDWRDLGGRWYIGDVQALRDVSDAELAGLLAEVDASLRHAATNREALRNLFVVEGEHPGLSRIAFDASKGEFVAGMLDFAENLTPFLCFFTVARGAAAFLGPRGTGVAMLHNYVYGGESEWITRAALRLGPGDRSAFLGESERVGVAEAFADVTTEILMSEDPPVINHLDSLR